MPAKKGRLRRCTSLTPENPEWRVLRLQHSPDTPAKSRRGEGVGLLHRLEAGKQLGKHRRAHPGSRVVQDGRKNSGNFYSPENFLSLVRC